VGIRWRSGSSLLIALLAVVFAACNSDAPATPAVDAAGTPAPTAPREVQSLTFMAGFRAQANLPFVAVYVAKERGFFDEEGLQVDVRHASGQDEHLKLLLAKEIAFTTATGAQAIRRYGDGLPVRAVALFGQRGDQGYVVREDSGIRGPADFRGRTVGYKAGIVPAELEGLLASAGMTKDDVRLQAVGFDPRVFIEGRVDVYPVFLNNEPYAIRKAGVPITVIDPADHGVATLGLTYLAHADSVTGDPDLVRRFLRAALRGAQYAAEHPDEAVQATMKYAEGADPGLQRFLLDTDLAAAARPDGMGRADARQWEALEATLVRYGVLTQPVGGAGVFAGEFVQSLYDGAGRLR
jgi:ABC-type nitrate/sulfonate/bicarbonate transport system substrate-binding protein